MVANFNANHNLDVVIQRIGDTIALGEGGYEAYNTGTLNGKVIHSYLHLEAGTVTGKTINEILESGSLSPTNTTRLFATGKYQTIIPTLKAGKEKLKLTGDEKYDADMQERFFRKFLIEKAGGQAYSLCKKKRGDR